MTSTFLWRHHFPQYFSSAETGAGNKSLLSLKATEKGGPWAGRSFSLRSTITGTRGCLVAAVLGEALSLHCIPLSMVRWKPFGCLSLQALAQSGEQNLTRIQLASETSGMWWGGGNGWDYLLSRSRGKKRGTKSYHVHNKCMKNILHVHVKLFWAHTPNYSDTLFTGPIWKRLISNRLYGILRGWNNRVDNIFYVYMWRCTQKAPSSIWAHRHITTISWLISHTSTLIV